MLATTTPVGAITSTTAPAAPRTPIPGFGEIGFRALANGVPQTDIQCAALANTDGLRAQGLQNRPNLSGYDAMLFAYLADTTAPFTMQNTLIPLTLAWFAADGKLLGSVDMAVVAAGQTAPTYPPPGPYRTAIEVPQGKLASVGFVSGTTLQTSATCRAS